MNRLLPILLCLILSASSSFGQDDQSPKTKLVPDDHTARRAVMDEELRDQTRKFGEVEGLLADQEPSLTVLTPPNETQRPGTLPPADPNQPITASRVGLSLVEADPVLRSQLGVPDGQGLVVLKVEGPNLERMGFQEKDLILKMNDDPVSTVAQADEMIAKRSLGGIEYQLIRRGKPLRISLLGPNYDKPSAPTYWIGVPVSPIDATLRSHLTELPDGMGLIADDVLTNSPADRAGIRKTDILVKCDDQPLTSQDRLGELIRKSQGKEIGIEVLRGGKPITLTVIPEKRPPDDARAVNTVIEDLSKMLDKTPNGRTFYRSVQPFVLPPRAEFKVDDIARNPYLVDGSPYQQQAFMPMPYIAAPVLQSPALEQEVKKLSEQVEELRKIINELRKQREVDKTSKSDQ